MENYYITLEIDQKATIEDIKKAYRKLILIYHPDKNRDDPYTKAYFNKVDNAYRILIDPEKRELHDQQLKRKPTEKSRSGFFSFLYTPERKECYVVHTNFCSELVTLPMFINKFKNKIIPDNILVLTPDDFEDIKQNDNYMVWEKDKRLHPLPEQVTRLVIKINLLADEVFALIDNQSDFLASNFIMAYQELTKRGETDWERIDHMIFEEYLLSLENNASCNINCTIS